MHIATTGNAGPDAVETRRRIVGRIRRYAQIAAAQDAPAAVYADVQIANGIVADLLRPAYGLTVLRLPVKGVQKAPHLARGAR